MNPEIPGYARFVTDDSSHDTETPAATDDPTDADVDDPTDELAARRRRREREAAEIASEIADENPDPVTRREAIEQGLEEEGLSEEGGTLGQHND